MKTWRLPLTEQRLAAYLAAAIQDSSSLDASTTSKMRWELTHVHLPALESAGLITWNTAEGTVDFTSHPAVSDPRFSRLLETELEGFNEVLSTLSHDYRRIILTVLNEGGAPVSRSQLTQHIQQMTPDTLEIARPNEDVLEVSIHHVHLPRLDDDGFISYTPETATVTYTDNPVLEEVFSIIYDRDASTVDKLDGFFNGIAESYRQARQEAPEELAWPHFWRDASHG